MADLKKLATDLAHLTKQVLSVVGGDAEQFEKYFSTELALPLDAPAKPSDIVITGLSVGSDIAVATGNEKAITVMKDIEELGDDVLEQKYGTAVFAILKDIKDFKALAKK